MLLLLLAPCNLLVLLDEIAGPAATSTKPVLVSVAREVVCGAYIAAREHRKDELQSAEG